jgi:hypothetical protein
MPKAAFNPNGVILWEGASAIDGAPIVVIATGLKRGSRNGKTGAQVQTFIQFTNGGKRRPATLTLNVIADGRRRFVSQQPVTGKREARAIAERLGARPWNF